MKRSWQACLLLFSAAYASVQNLVTSVILDGSARFTYRFVVLFSTYEIASFPLFMPSLTCLILDLLSTFLQRQTTKSGINMARSARQKSTPVRMNKHMDMRRKTQFDDVRSGYLFYNCKNVTTT